MKIPEQYRLVNHPILGSDSSYRCNGFFVIPHHRISNYFYNCQVSDGMGWQHVSVTLTKQEFKVIGRVRVSKKTTVLSVERCCTWEEMCHVKSLFWTDEETVMQLHPPKYEYVNQHQYCLHLWKPDNKEIPLPDSLMVGISVATKAAQRTFS